MKAIRVHQFGEQAAEAIESVYQGTAGAKVVLTA